MAQITLPNRFKPRPYQNAVMAYFDGGGKRACTVWHRRAGKDTTAIHQITKMAHQRIGLYWHMLPTQRQGRKVVWDAFTRSGERLIDQSIPQELRKGDPNNTEMKMHLRCGSMYQVVGSDNYDSLVGSNPVGVVFSEWSLTDPRIWDYIRPILMENGGWAWFIYTPRGYNHGFDIKETAESNPEWFYSLKTIDDTGVLTRKDVDAEIADGMPAELAEQEFYCSFSSANVGAILGGLVEKAQQAGRISGDVTRDVHGGELITSCDIGFRDTAAFWHWQVKPDGAALLGYDEASGRDAAGWIDHFQAEGREIDTLYMPHDAKAKTFATRMSAMEQFMAAGFKVRLVPKTSISDRIQAARTVMPHCHFNATECKPGLMALRDWSFKWDDVRKLFSKDPDHNWASHGGDGFSYGAQAIMHHARAWKSKLSETPKPKQKFGEGANYVFSLEQLHNDTLNNRRMARI